MIKLLLVLALAIPLGGCLTVGDVTTGVTLATTGVPNPITKDKLKALEDTSILTFAGLGAYKKACLAHAVDVNCRTTIANVQVYTRKYAALLPDLRTFVKNNDQVNAIKAYNLAQTLIADYKATATANGIQVQ